MADRRILTPEVLRQLLRYEPETGLLFWRRRDRHWFSTDSQYRRWNTRYADKRAFTSTNAGGYAASTVASVMMVSHRAIWAMVHGRWPTGEIDHINGVRSDNRLSNLREVSKKENARNCRLSRRNKSGHVGVFWCERQQRWHANIGVEHRVLNLGYYKTKDAAISARKAAEARYDFHENHGNPA